MDRRFWRRLTQTFTILTLTILIGLAITGADRPRSMLRESVTLPADSNVIKRFRAIDDYLTEKRWADAIELLQEIAQTDGRLLVKVQEGTSTDSSVYLNVATRCNILLSRLPKDGLDAYRKKVDPQARRWMDHWKLTHNEADLHKIVREAYLSSMGDDALLALGETAWDQRDIESARLYWTQLVPLGQEAREINLPTVLRYPDSDLNQAEILARLILCTIAENEQDRASAEISRLMELHPDAEGRLAGRNGQLSEILKQIQHDALNWQPLADADSTTFALTMGRNGTVSDSVELGAPKWSQGLPSNKLPPFDRQNLLNDKKPLSYHPVTWQDYVFVNSSRSIWAWNLVTGEPAWPSEGRTAEIYPPASDVAGGLPNQRLYGGAPHYTMTISEGRLYARMGSVITNGASDEEPGDSDLICLDIERGQGKIQWKISSRELTNDPKPWRFEGAPVVMSGRAYIVLSRRPNFEFAVACLDASTGALIWHRPVAASRATFEDHINRVSHLLLTSGAGKLYLSTDAGTILALSAKDGRLDWAITYESVGRTLATAADDSLTPAMYHKGLLFVAPNDCNRLFCIEADSGRVRWQFRHPEGERWRHLLGVVPGGQFGRLIVSGRNLASIDIGARKIVFGPKAAGLTARPEQGYGRGLLVGKTVLWPTQESIKTIDARTGTVLANKPLHVPGSAEIGGNLTVAQGMLLVAQPERMVAYCEYSLLKQRLQDELSLRLKAPSLTTDSSIDGHAEAVPFASTQNGHFSRRSTERINRLLSDVDFAQGNFEGAISRLRDCLQKSVEAQDVAAESQYRSRLLYLLRQAGRTAKSEGDTTTAVERLTEARQLSTEPNDVAAVLMDLGEAELGQRRPVAAMEAWQQILDDEKLRDVVIQGTTAGSLAAKSMSRVIRDRGRAVYATIEGEANQAIAARLEAGDPEGLRTLLRQYPHAESVGQAWRKLASLDFEASRFQEALAIHAYLVDQSVLPQERAAALADWSRALERAGYWRSARESWKKLESSDISETPVVFEGASVRAGELAREQLERPIYQSSGRQSQQLSRTWQMGVGTSSIRDVDAVLVPENEAPSMNLDCVLVHRWIGDKEGFRCDCIDRSTGQTRWSRSTTKAIRWVACAPTHLVVATDLELSAWTFESGTELWSTVLSPTEGQTGVRRVFSDRDPRRMTQAGKPIASDQIRLALRDRWVLLFNPNSGLKAIDHRTGKTAWSFLPARGRLQSEWACGVRQVALQTITPPTTWLLDIAADRQISELPGTQEAWMQGPVIDDQTVVTVDIDRRIQGQSLGAGPQWKYRGGMSMAHTNPVLWKTDSQLLLAVDGITLTKINPSTGRVQWTAGIADFPLNAVRDQIVANDESAWAVSQGILRQIRLDNGELISREFLGDLSDQWKIRLFGDVVAAWPLVDNQAGSRRQFVIWCDAKTGHFLQRMNLPVGERISNVTADEAGWLIETDLHLTSYIHRPVSAPLNVATTAQ